MLHRPACFALLALILAATTGCDSGGNGAEDGGGNGNGDIPGYSGSVTATVDGSSFEADVVMTTIVKSTLTITALDTLSGESLTLRVPDAAEGTFAVGPSGAMAIWQGAGGAEVFYGVSGEVRLSEFSDSGGEGTFEFTADSEFPTGKRQTRSSGGSSITINALGAILFLEALVVANLPSERSFIECALVVQDFHAHVAGKSLGQVPILWLSGFTLYIPQEDLDGKLVGFGFNGQTFGPWEVATNGGNSVAESYLTGGGPDGYIPDISLSFSVGASPQLEEEGEYPVGVVETGESATRVVGAMVIDGDPGDLNGGDDVIYRADSEHGGGGVVIHALNLVIRENNEITGADGSLYIVFESDEGERALCIGKFEGW